MKKTIRTLLTVAIALLSVGAYAQNEARLGVKGGVNLSTLRIDEELAEDNIKVGFNLGLFAKLPLGEAFAIQPELLYTSKGSKLTYDGFLLGDGEYRFNLDYLEVPVLGVFQLGENFNIHVGPYVSYLVNANVTDLEDDGSIEEVSDLNEESFNRVDYGIAAGIGFQSTSGVMLGIRYNHGFGEIGDDGISGELTSDSKHSVGQIYIGFGF